MFRPASRRLVVRRRSSFSRGIVASLSFQSWLFWGSRLFKRCARRGSRCRPSKLRRNRLTFRSRRTATPPLNSSVRRQSNLFAAFLRSRLPGFASTSALCVTSGRPAWQYFVRLVAYRRLRALSYCASSCRTLRAVRGSVAVVVSGLFSSRRPPPTRHCRAFKAALSCGYRAA